MKPCIFIFNRGNIIQPIIFQPIIRARWASLTIISSYFLDMKIGKLVLFLLALSVFSSCTGLSALDLQGFKNLKEPKVNLVGLQLSQADLLSQKFLVKLQLENPNDQSFSVDGIDVAVALNGHHIAQGATTKPLTLEKHGSSMVEIATVANALSLLQQAQTLAKKKFIDYEVSGHVSVLPGLFSWVKLPLSYRGKITLDQLKI